MLTTKNMGLGDKLSELLRRYHSAVGALDHASRALQTTTAAMEQGASAAALKEGQLVAAALSSLRQLRAHLTQVLGGSRRLDDTAADGDSAWPPIRITSLHRPSSSPRHHAAGSGLVRSPRAVAADAPVETLSARLALRASCSSPDLAPSTPSPNAADAKATRAATAAAQANAAKARAKAVRVAMEAQSTAAAIVAPSLSGSASTPNNLLSTRAAHSAAAGSRSANLTPIDQPNVHVAPPFAGPPAAVSPHLQWSDPAAVRSPKLPRPSRPATPQRDLIRHLKPLTAVPGYARQTASSKTATAAALVGGSAALEVLEPLMGAGFNISRVSPTTHAANLKREAAAAATSASADGPADGDARPLSSQPSFGFDL